MLSFLNQKGPLTKGIFRQSANMKSCRELKEKLNSGIEVHLDCESIFVIASVLKVRIGHPLRTPDLSLDAEFIPLLTLVLLEKNHDRFGIKKKMLNNVTKPVLNFEGNTSNVTTR